MLLLKEISTSYKRDFTYSEIETIKTPDSAYKILLPYFDDVINYKECFYVLYLSKANQVVNVMKLSEGGIDSTIVDIKILLQGALLCNATSLILAHNHPSGQLKPSQADIKITENIKKACDIFSIQLLDHLILTSESYISILNL